MQTDSRPGVLTDPPSLSAAKPLISFRLSGSSHVIGCFLRSHSQLGSVQGFIYFFLGTCGDIHPSVPSSHHALCKRAASLPLLFVHLPSPPHRRVCFSTVELTLLPRFPFSLLRIIVWIIDPGQSYKQETDSCHNSISTPALCPSSHALSPSRLLPWFPSPSCILFVQL